MKKVSVKSQSCVPQVETISHANFSMEGVFWEEREIHLLDHGPYSAPMRDLFAVLHSNIRTHGGRYHTPQYLLRQNNRTLCDYLLAQLYPQLSYRKSSQGVARPHILPQRSSPVCDKLSASRFSKAYHEIYKFQPARSSNYVPSPLPSSRVDSR